MDVVEEEAGDEQTPDPTEGRWHMLKAVKFNSVSHLTVSIHLPIRNDCSQHGQIFIRDNQGGEDATKGRIIDSGTLT